MAKMQGKVKAISVKGVTEGMQVIWENCMNGYIYIVQQIEGDKVTIKAKETQSYTITIPKNVIKTLVVEYEVTNPMGVRSEKDFQTKQLPLKYSQWQSAIDNGEVDSDKIVEFEIIDKTIVDYYTMYAKIIPTKQTWDDIQALAYNEFIQSTVICAFGPWYVNWLEENYHAPKRK